MRRLRPLRLPLLLLILAGLGAHSAAQAPPAESETASPSLETFEPSEKVPADVAVPFPVDI